MNESETVSLDLNAPAAPAPTTPVNPSFTGAPGNFQADMAALANEQNPQTVPPVQDTPVIEPAQPTAAVTPVPEKFQNPDGTANVEKIEKSTLHAEEAFKKYQDIERQLRQKQNEVAALKNGSPVPVVPNAAPVNAQALNLSPLEIQMAQDYINEAAALGYQVPQAQAIAQAKVMAKGLEAKYNAEQTRLEQIGQRLEDQDKRRELESLAANDPWVISPEGVETLQKIRETRPWVNVDPNRAWTAAYDQYLADKVKSERLKGTVQPNPTGLTAKAPPTPVGPAPRVSVQATEKDWNKASQSEVMDHVKNMTPAQESAFWASRGLKFR
jgi:hypothetical protein